jgi:hypothetical protein
VKRQFPHKLFVNGVIKLQRRKPEQLSMQEKDAVASLVKDVGDNDRSAQLGVQGSEDEYDDYEVGEEEGGNLMDDIEKKRKREAIEDQHGYANPNFIVGSAAEVARFWSMAGLIMTDKRVK